MINPFFKNKGPFKIERSIKIANTMLTINRYFQ